MDQTKSSTDTRRGWTTSACGPRTIIWHGLLWRSPNVFSKTNPCILDTVGRESSFLEGSSLLLHVATHCNTLQNNTTHATLGKTQHLISLLELVNRQLWYPSSVVSLEVQESKGQKNEAASALLTFDVSSGAHMNFGRVQMREPACQCLHALFKHVPTNLCAHMLLEQIFHGYTSVHVKLKRTTV